MKRRGEKACAALLACAMCISTIDANVFAEEDVTAVGSTISSGDSLVEEGSRLPLSWQQDNLVIDFNVVNEWDTGYQCAIFYKMMKQYVLLHQQITIMK